MNRRRFVRLTLAAAAARSPSNRQSTGSRPAGSLPIPADIEGVHGAGASTS